MEDIEFSCPNCELVLAAPEDMAGQLVECPECKHQMAVPGAEDEMEEAVSDGPTCPECGQVMQPDSVLCMGCGFHTVLGKKITTEFQ